MPRPGRGAASAGPCVRPRGDGPAGRGVRSPRSPASSWGLRSQELVENAATSGGLGGPGPPVRHGPRGVERAGRPGRPGPAEPKSLHRSGRKARRPPGPFSRVDGSAHPGLGRPDDGSAPSQEPVGGEAAVSEHLSAGFAALRCLRGFPAGSGAGRGERPPPHVRRRLLGAAERPAAKANRLPPRLKHLVSVQRLSPRHGVSVFDKGVSSRPRALVP